MVKKSFQSNPQQWILRKWQQRSIKCKTFFIYSSFKWAHTQEKKIKAYKPFAISIRMLFCLEQNAHAHQNHVFTVELCLLIRCFFSVGVRSIKHRMCCGVCAVAGAAKILLESWEHQHFLERASTFWVQSKCKQWRVKWELKSHTRVHSCTHAHT